MSYAYSHGVKAAFVVLLLAEVIGFSVVGSVPVMANRDSVPMPDKDMAVSLIYETIIAVNNASQTSNFSVLRALGAPEFQAKYKTEDLDQTFRGLRQKNIDLRPVVLLKPVIQKSQYLPSKKLFRLRGFMPTHPIRLGFEIHYQYVEKRWRLYALSFDFNNTLSTSKMHMAAQPDI